MKRPLNHFASSAAKRPSMDDTINRQRRALPVFKVRKRLMKEIERHPTLIILGETGSGKTTQIPQLMLENGFAANGMIGVTQPRRVAAITVAQRVSKEMRCEMGATVGYCVRFEDTTSPGTSIKYMTDGMLLRESIRDPLLMNYSVIILDEAHERTIHTDVLFGIIKSAQKSRAAQGQSKSLKVIVMSATMDADQFSEYLGGAPIVYLEGRQYPVKVFHSASSQGDYNFSVLNAVFKIHREAPVEYDVLVFLTGQEEIEAMAMNIRSIAKNPLFGGPLLKVFTLYAAMSHQKQMEVFQTSNGFHRKIILATNIAETSITLPGIRFVIDSGKVKSRYFESKTGMEVLRIGSISQAQAWQRTGRAGRDAPGAAYRTYTQEEFLEMEKSTKPEILRCNLSTVILQLLALKINATDFDFMDKPPQETLNEGMKLLKMLGAVEDDGSGEPKMTGLGNRMVQFPLDPRFAKIILEANKYTALDDILTVVSLLSGESIFVTNMTKREEAAAARAKFTSTSGDLITLVNVVKGYSTAPNKSIWCYENFINQRNIEYASKVRAQLVEVCQRVGLTPVQKKEENSEENELENFSKAMLSGLYMNVARLSRDNKYTVVGSGEVVQIHPTSVLHGTKSPLVMFAELVKTTRTYIRHCTPVDPEWLPARTDLQPR